MFLIFILVMALAGPAVIGAISAQRPGRIRLTLLMCMASLFPVFVAALVRLWDRFVDNGPAFFGPVNHGHEMMELVWWVSIVLVPVALVLAILGKAIGQYWSNDLGG